MPITKYFPVPELQPRLDKKVMFNLNAQFDITDKKNIYIAF